MYFRNKEHNPPAASAVASARTMSGLSQKQLAAITGIDQSDISKIERGVANPSIATLERIAGALGGQLSIRIAMPENVELEEFTMKEKIVQTAGRQQLGEFAPMFAHLNDDVLFGEVWNEDTLDVKTKCIITVVSLMASGITDSSLTYHLQNAKAHGVTKEEIAAIITHVAMYVGWPKGWAVFRLAREVWSE